MDKIQRNDPQEVKVFNRSQLLGHEIDVYGDAINPLFLAKDVAEWIEHTDARKMVQAVDDDERLTGTLFLSGQHRSVWFLTENGLYEILMLSRKPIAKGFKKGVKNILYEIRTKGGYSPAWANLPNFDDPVAAARAWADEKEKSLKLEALNKAQQEHIEIITPKADFADQLFRVEGKIHIGTCAKVLGLPFGPKTVFKKLRERGIMFKNSTEVCQRYIDAGYFVMEVKHFVNGGKDFLVSVTYATLKGLAYIGYLFGKKPNADEAQAMFAEAQRIDGENTTRENKQLYLQTF